MFKQKQNMDYIINDDMKPKQRTSLEQFAKTIEIIHDNYYLIDEIIIRIKDNKFDASEIETIKDILQNRMSQIASGDGL